MNVNHELGDQVINTNRGDKIGQMGDNLPYVSGLDQFQGNWSAVSFTALKSAKTCVISNAEGMGAVTVCWGLYSWKTILCGVSSTAYGAVNTCAQWGELQSRRKRDLGKAIRKIVCVHGRIV